MDSTKTNTLPVGNAGNGLDGALNMRDLVRAGVL